MMRRMDSGVSWFENEITNVIREGRNNPSVPITEKSLYLIEILHQTTTSSIICHPPLSLYLIEILHQTTTIRCLK